MASVQVNNILDNEHVTIGVSVLLVLFSTIITPKLPLNILIWFNNWIVQIALFFAILYISDKNIVIAIIATIALLITIMVTNNKLTLNILSNVKSNEGFDSTAYGVSDDQSPVNAMDLNREYLNQITNQSDNSSDLSADLMKMDVTNIQRSGLDVEGICDESISQHDDSVALQEYAINNNQESSVNGPKVIVNTESADSDSESLSNELPKTNPESVNSELNNNVVGIKQHEIEDETMGSALNNSELLGSDYGSANHDDIRINSNLNVDFDISDSKSE
jgi:hypothetical protein